MDKLDKHILSCKLNSSLLIRKEYLTELINKKIIKLNKDKKNSKLYFLTYKGDKYLEDFYIIKNFMKSYE